MDTYLSPPDMIDLLSFACVLVAGRRSSELVTSVAGILLSIATNTGGEATSTEVWEATDGRKRPLPLLALIPSKAAYLSHTLVFGSRGRLASASICDPLLAL